jgi:glycosyltransferase involved in cell wall biosynthesis
MKILIYHKVLSSLLGGGTFQPLMFIAKLQRYGEVTVALNDGADMAEVSRLAGVPIDVAALKVVRLDPEGGFAKKREWLAALLRMRRLKALAKDADLCISTANIMDFGKAAHHFVYLLSQFGGAAFYDYLMGRGKGFGPRRFIRRVETALYENVVKPLFGIRPLKRIVSDRRETIYPTSRYVEEILRGYFGPFNGKVFYPPTVFDFGPSAAARDPLLAIYVGRIFPPKRITDIVAIVEKARALSGKDLKLRIAGVLAPIPYTDRLRKLASERPWLELVGPVYGKDKEAFMLSATYALHAERDEAFGIAIAEYLKAGCIPVVPDQGGPREVVDDKSLEFGTIDEAASTLVRLAGDEKFREERRRHCAGRAALFTRAAYEERQREIVEQMIGK